ncbi:MAG: Crp/Fnr family transcriptional regulator, partial [Bacteroidota bacterium]
MIGSKVYTDLIDIDKLRAIYKFSKNLSLSDVQALLKAAKSRSFAPQEYLIEAGSKSRNAYLIRRGLVRTFMITEKGEEITTMLRWENQITTNIDSIFFNQASRFYFQALEQTEVLYMDYDLIQTIIAKNPKLEANRKHFLLNLLKEAISRMDSFVLLNPEERYLEFIKSNPDIINRVHNKYIANVLGITPVSLSRIRARIAS